LVLKYIVVVVMYSVVVEVWLFAARRAIYGNKIAYWRPE
jgi:hypothetical protein